MYHPVHTDDIQATLALLSTNYTNASFSCVAFSLGAVMLTRYLAEHPADSRLSAAIAICCPFDTRVAFTAMDSPSIFNDYVFNPNITKAIKRYVAKHQAAIQSGPIKYDFDAIRKATRMRQIDTLMTAPFGGFNSCDEYYEGASTVALVPSIQTPFLAINSRDDSCVPIEAIPISAFEANPYTALALVNNGGHLGFFTGLVPTIWYIDPVIEFLSAPF
ncbi:medium-chain fatty acid ethyl ester synthase/esterase 2 [Coemansia sp. RSA 2424]|nr:medium-chain fatty acid ethyl ester synthase/esterase 2 [Coemansia sp. RSA 2424]